MSGVLKPIPWLLLQQGRAHARAEMTVHVILSTWSFYFNGAARTRCNPIGNSGEEAEASRNFNGAARTRA